MRSPGAICLRPEAAMITAPNALSSGRQRPHEINFAQLSRGAGPDRSSHEPGEVLALLRREPQAELRSAPQNIVAGLRPFAFHQIAHLGGGEIGTQASSEILEPLRRSEDPLDAGPVGAHQPRHKVLMQQWPRLADFCYEAIEPVPGKLTSGQIGGPRPCRPGLYDMGKTVDGMLGQAPISGDLTPVYGEERRLAGALVEGDDII